MKAALVGTWAHPVAGREKKALEFAVEVAEFWGARAAEGKCSPPEMLLSESGGAVWFVKGDRDTLLAIHDTEEGRLLTMKSDLLLENFKLDVMYVDESAAEVMAIYGKALAVMG